MTKQEFIKVIFKAATGLEEADVEGIQMLKGMFEHTHQNEVWEGALGRPLTTEEKEWLDIMYLTLFQVRV